MELGAPNLKPVFKHSFLDPFLHLAPFTFPTPRLVLTFLVFSPFVEKPRVVFPAVYAVKKELK